MLTPREVQNSLRCPRSYKRDLERMEVAYAWAKRRVEALEQERDALRYRLQVATAESERLRRRARTGPAPRQAELEA
jgi:hypothetical protein